MSEQLARLMNPPTATQLRDKLLEQLKGIGWTSHTGFSPGSVTATGVPIAAAQVRVKIIGAGDLGVGTFQFSTNGGATYSATITIPSNGQYALLFTAATGCTLVFANGIAGTPGGASFVVGDVYAFELKVSMFPVTAWQPLSVPRSMVENDAEALADLYELVRLIARGGLVAYSFDDWLDVVAQQFYGLTRRKGVPTKGTVQLVDAGNTGPHVVAAGSIIVSTPGGLRYINDDAWTLTLGGTVNKPFTAERPGSSYNVGNNNISVLVTTLTGVTVNNPDPGSGTWITQSGTDDELDAALAARCIARWPGLGLGSPTSSYDALAKEASIAVTKTLSIISPSAPGQVNVYLAGDAGPVAGPVVSAVQSYLIYRVPICVIPIALSAANFAVVVAGTVFAAAGTLAQTQAEVSANLVALIKATPIGGTIYRSKLLEEIQRATGVRNVTPLTTPAADLVLATTEVATLTNNLVFSAV